MNVPRQLRRHQVDLSDAEVSLIERALRCYAQVIQIQTSGMRLDELKHAAHVSILVQRHQPPGNCECPKQKEP